MFYRVRDMWQRSRTVRWLIPAAAVAAMWHFASRQFAGGVTDLLVFAPPAAVLGLAATWAGHVFAPQRFTWRRGLVGAVTGALVVGPLAAALVGILAEWKPASFLIVFTVGAWVALAVGLVVGGAIAATRWLVRRAKRQASSRRWHFVHLPRHALTRTPDARGGIRPTPLGRPTHYDGP